jgi:cytochrome c biogenesis protein CcdA
MSSFLFPRLRCNVSCSLGITQLSGILGRVGCSARFFFGINNLGFFQRICLKTGVGSSVNERANSIKLNALTRFSKYNYAASSFLFGLVISVALGPCSLSIVLPAVLLTMLTAPTPFHGGLLLLMFGLGHALPVIFLSTALATTRQMISQKISEKGEWLTKGFGAAFLAIGIIIIGYALWSFLL